MPLPISSSTRASRTNSLSCDGNDPRIAPQPLELIELAQRRVEQMHDKIDEIEKNPTALTESFDVVSSCSELLHLFYYVFPNRAHVCIRRPTPDDEEVGHVGHPAQIEQHDIVRLVLHTDRSRSPSERIRAGRGIGG